MTAVVTNPEGLLRTPMGPVLQLTLLVVTTSAATFARNAMGPLQESMRMAIPLSDNQIAVLQGPALALPVVLGAIPLGILVDRQSRVRLLLVLAVCNLIGTVLTSRATHFGWLLGARAIVGLAATATPVAAYSLVADLYAPAQRGRANMVMAIGQACATALAFALGGTLVTSLGLGPGGWREAMLWMAIPLAPVVLGTLMLREPGRSGTGMMMKPSASDAWNELREYGHIVLPLLAGLVTVEVAVGATVVWAAPALSRNFSLAPDRVGAIMAASLLTSGVLGPVAGGVLADVCQRTGGPRRTISALSALTLLSAAVGLFGIAPTLGFACVLLVAFNTAVNAIAVAVTTLSTLVIPNELRGFFLAVLSAVGMTCAFVVAPIAVSALSGWVGALGQIGVALAAICVATCLLSAATFALTRRFFPSTA